MRAMEETLADLPRRMTEAWNRGDATAFAADFTETSRLVEFNGDVVVGRDALVRGQQPMFDTVLKDSKLVDGEVLFAEIVEPGIGIVHYRSTLLMAGEDEPRPTRTSMQLIVARRHDDRWRVVVLQNARKLSFEHAGQLDALN